MKRKLFRQPRLNIQLNLPEGEKKDKVKKPFKFDPIQVITTSIACISLFIAYKSMQMTRLEKGVDIEPKISFKFSAVDSGNAKITVQNLSNIPIAINSAYFVRFEIDTIGNKLYYRGVDFPISYDELKPYQIKDTVIKQTFYNPLKDESTDKYILEARIYYSRKIDGETYGLRSFYTYTDYIVSLFEDENGLIESIDGLENLPNPDDREADRKRARYEKMKLSYINKLKNNAYYQDSIQKIGVESAPNLKDIAPVSDKVYQIKL